MCRCIAAVQTYTIALFGPADPRTRLERLLAVINSQVRKNVDISPNSSGAGLGGWTSSLYRAGVLASIQFIFTAVRIVNMSKS